MGADLPQDASASTEERAARREKGKGDRYVAKRWREAIRMLEADKSVTIGLRISRCQHSSVESKTPQGPDPIKLALRDGSGRYGSPGVMRHPRHQGGSVEIVQRASRQKKAGSVLGWCIAPERPGIRATVK